MADGSHGVLNTLQRFYKRREQIEKEKRQANLEACILNCTRAIGKLFEEYDGVWMDASRIETIIRRHFGEEKA